MTSDQRELAIILASLLAYERKTVRSDLLSVQASAANNVSGHRVAPILYLVVQHHRLPWNL